MKARLIIPTAAGELVSYDIVGRAGQDMKIVFATTEEPFERWLFYMMRDLGGHVVTDNVDGFRKALGLTGSEEGVIDESKVEEPLLNRHPATA